MGNKMPFDRSLFIPIFIGLFSLLGICLVLFATRLGASRGNVQIEDTATPMKYQYLGTEPVVVLPTEVASPTTEPSPTIVSTIEIILPTLTSRSTSVGQPFSTNTPTPSASPTIQFLNVTYDDADFKFLYTGNWVKNTVSDTYQSTLHISNAIGDSVQLSFVGQKIRFTYQAGPSLGTIAIKLDKADYALDQSASETAINSWESPVLVLSSHSITITHISGGAINIDAIAVLDLATPTPTATPTP
jgi:hypothetical protein